MPVEQHRRSNAQSGDVGLAARVAYLAKVLAWQARQPNGKEAADRALAEAQEIAATYERETGRPAGQARVVEIGFGTRPRRALALSLLFGEVHALDLDVPMLRLADFPKLYRQNGPVRAIKSAIRFLLFDAAGWPAFHARLRSIRADYDPARTRFVIGNAGEAATWNQLPAPDLIFSSDVFEHIPLEDLRSLLVLMRARLAEGGLVITRPMIFTGISGGHTADWYETEVERRRGSAGAWRHLTDDDFVVDTYLNRLTRREFVELFEEAGFRVIEDHAVFGRMGEKHMTPQLRATLSQYDDYELYSNRVSFVLA
jgi:hypothetical protein